jgi:hypothetical protein
MYVNKVIKSSNENVIWKSEATKKNWFWMRLRADHKQTTSCCQNHWFFLHDTHQQPPIRKQKYHLQNLCSQRTTIAKPQNCESLRDLFPSKHR